MQNLSMVSKILRKMVDDVPIWASSWTPAPSEQCGPLGYKRMQLKPKRDMTKDTIATAAGEEMVEKARKEVKK